jgi:hypothetical protein
VVKDPVESLGQVSSTDPDLTTPPEGWSTNQWLALLAALGVGGYGAYRAITDEDEDEKSAADAWMEKEAFPWGPLRRVPGLFSRAGKFLFGHTEPLDPLLSAYGASGGGRRIPGLFGRAAGAMRRHPYRTGAAVVGTPAALYGGSKALDYVRGSAEEGAWDAVKKAPEKLWDWAKDPNVETWKKVLAGGGIGLGGLGLGYGATKGMQALVGDEDKKKKKRRSAY